MLAVALLISTNALVVPSISLHAVAQTIKDLRFVT